MSVCGLVNEQIRAALPMIGISLAVLFKKILYLVFLCVYTSSIKQNMYKPAYRCRIKKATSADGINEVTAMLVTKGLEAAVGVGKHANLAG